MAAPPSADEIEEYFKLLEAEFDISDEDLKKKYRKLAILKHPDKNPDDPLAGENFAKLSQAYEYLKDSEKRKAYESQQKAKLERKRKLNMQDDERRKMRAQLEENERRAAEKQTQVQTQKQTDEEAKIKLASEVAKLRKMFSSSSKKSSAETDMPPEFFAPPSPPPSSSSSSTAHDDSIDSCSIDTGLTLSVKWDSGSAASPPTQQQLERAFEQYGVIDSCVVTPRQAMISFADVHGLENALSFGSLLGYKLSRVGKASGATASSSSVSSRMPPQSSASAAFRQPSASSIPLPSVPSVPSASSFSSFPSSSVSSSRSSSYSASATSVPSSSSSTSHLSYEQQTLARMKALAEKKRLEKQQQEQQQQPS